MSDRNVILYGTSEPPPKFIELKAGPVRATFDGGQLRWIKVGGVEVIRAIAFLIRDRNWSTASALLSNVSLDQREDSFTLEFDARCPTIDGDFLWHGSFSGKSDGSITCIGRGHPERDFVTGRTGFVILHPLRGTVGETLTIEHTDGTVEKAHMPEAIVPDQPFFNVRAMTHQPLPGVRATIRMEGDAWETEDHRNWTDASLKTYCRPLSLPWPYEIPAGQEVRQSVLLSFEGRLPEAGPVPHAVSVTVGEERGRVPALGLSVLPEDAEKAAGSSELVASAGFSHLNVRLDLRHDKWHSPLAHYRSLADRARTQVVLEIILAGDRPPSEELGPVAETVNEAGLRPEAVVVTPAQDLQSYPPGTPFPEGVPSYESLAAAARKAFPKARIGGGMLSNFTELNRKRPPTGVFDFIVHATSGLVHAADDRSVMETLESIGHIIRATKKIAGKASYRIGPSHIGNSFNPYGSSVTPNPENRRVTMARVEPRHRGLFGAAWHLGFLSQVADGGLEAATMASPVGEFGIAYAPGPHAQPLYDEATPAPLVYPLYHVLAGVAKGAGNARVELLSGDTDRVRGLAWRDGKTLHVWLANMTVDDLVLDVSGIPAGSAVVLDEVSFAEAIGDPAFMQQRGTAFDRSLVLPAYAVAHVTGKAS